MSWNNKNRDTIAGDPLYFLRKIIKSVSGSGSVYQVPGPNLNSDTARWYPKYTGLVPPSIQHLW
jgi:hypothetical protein